MTDPEAAPPAEPRAMHLESDKNNRLHFGSWMQRKSRWFPNTAFSVAVGLGGNSVLWSKMSASNGSSMALQALASLFWFMSLSVLLVCLVAYIAKATLNFDVVKAEWLNPLRVNFTIMPVVCLLMLGLSLPPGIFGQEDAELLMRAIWYVGFLCQTAFSLEVYFRWTFATEESTSIMIATPPFFLSVLGWFLLCILASPRKGNMLDAIGIDVASVTFAIGCFFTFFIYVGIFQSSKNGSIKRGLPTTCLIVVPPVVVSLSINSMMMVVTNVSKGFLGLAVLLFLLLVRSGIQLFKEPPIFGAYWAYVSPLAVLATLGMDVATAEETQMSQNIAWILVVVAECFLVFAIFETCLHFVFVALGRREWKDMLVMTLHRRGLDDISDANVALRLECVCG